MAATYTVKRRKQESGTAKLERNSGQSRKRISSSEKWYVHVEGVAPEAIDALAAASHPDLPAVGLTVKTSPDGSVVYPYLLCVEKSFSRNKQNASFIEVSVKYDEDEYGNGDSVPEGTTPDNVPPRILAKTIANTETAWDDIDGKAYRLPNGLPYSDPGIRETGGMQYEITKYDSSMTNAAMRTRRCSVNSDAVRIGNIIHQPRTLKIVDVNVDFGVKWNLNPSGSPVYITTNRVKYTVQENNPAVRVLTDAGAQDTVYPGWDKMMINDSSQALNVANDFTTRVPILSSLIAAWGTWFLKSDGTAHAANVNNAGAPPQSRFKFQQELAFSSFLF